MPANVFGQHIAADPYNASDGFSQGATILLEVPGIETVADILWGVPSIRRYPYTGSAIYYWDTGPVREDTANPGSLIGTEPPPYENVPNRSGADPHGAPRATPAEQQLVSDFFGGAIPQSDNCGDGPCFAIGFAGP